jgi:CheY-like chemotaxis protein
MLKDRDLDSRNRERADIVARSGEHLLRMINEVLDFSKIEAGHVELNPAPFDLGALLQDIVANQRPKADAKDLEFLFDAPGSDEHRVLGDAQKLRQAVENLVGNAIKFTLSGTIQLRVQPVDEEHFAFEVIDTGVGLSEQDVANLFVPFKQSVSGRPPEPGTGLGLSISQHLVGLMGGRIEVTSTPGEGSRFHFTVPLPSMDLAETDSEADSLPVSGYVGDRRRIMVIDDVAVNRTLIGELLIPVGFTVEPHATADEALATLQDPADLPDGIIVDLRMPGINGLEFTRRIRERFGPRPKIILMSASVLAFDPQTALDAGCDDFLPKPFRERDLLERLGRALKLTWQHDTPSVEHDSTGTGPARHLEATTYAEVRNRLLELAQRGDISGIRAEIESWDTQFTELATLADNLRPLVAAYQMDRIRQTLATEFDPPAPA